MYRVISGFVSQAKFETFENNMLIAFAAINCATRVASKILFFLLKNSKRFFWQPYVGLSGGNDKGQSLHKQMPFAI